MALTLLEAAKLALNNGETKRAGVIAMFARASAWLAAIPMRDISGNAYAYNREGELPGVAFRGLNETYTPSTGIINPLSEALRTAGGYLDVDRQIVKQLGDSVRSAHEELKVKALAASVTNKIIKGDSTSDPREFDGLQARVTGAQLINAGGTDGGDPLSLAKLDEAIDATVGPNKQLWMSKAMRRRLTAAGRTPAVSGYITYRQDEFGRQISMYNEIPIVTAYPENDGTEPLAFDEVGSGGSTATATSIYVVSLGEGYFSGIQNGMMEVIDQGLIDSEPKFRTLVEWALAPIVIEHGKAVTRLRGISNAAVVA